MKEFNLSDEIDDRNERLLVEDVKKFIRLEDKLLVRVRNGEITWGEFWTLKIKLVGEKLS